MTRNAAEPGERQLVKSRGRARYRVHARRGSEAIEAAAILTDFGGVAVHDGWAPYRNYERRRHALCNIHHLRELEAATEAGHAWPVAMSCLLLDTRDLGERARSAGRGCLDADALGELTASFTTIIAMGHDEHPPLAAGKRAKAHNLLLRLERYEPDVLRFAHDFRVPFGKLCRCPRYADVGGRSGCWRVASASPTCAPASRRDAVAGQPCSMQRMAHSPDERSCADDP